MAWRIQDAPGDEWSDIIVVLNANRKAVQLTVPQGDYVVVCHDGVISQQGLGEVSGNTVTVGPQSALIMHSK